MKKIFFLVLFFANIFIMNAQNLSDLIRADELTWYGIDFSMAKCTNTDASIDANYLKSLVRQWSLNPLSKNDIQFIKEEFLKKTIYPELLVSQERNATIDYKSMISKETKSLDINDIKKLLSHYDVHGQGYAILLVIEELRIPDADIWVAYINKNDKTLISARRVVCDGGGGIRNTSNKAIKRAITFGARNIKLD